MGECDTESETVDDNGKESDGSEGHLEQYQSHYN